MVFERFRAREVSAGEARGNDQGAAVLPKVRSRDFEHEPMPSDGDMRVFEVEAAARINRVRMDAISSLGLPLNRKRVLDVGSGPGHFVEFYTSRECELVALEGREDTADEFRRRHPAVRMVVADVQTWDLRELGRFDLIHCLGLLYHLENPLAALRNMFRVCDGILVLETIIMDAAGPYVTLADEPKTVNQALAGLGCRPSPTFVTMALNRVGFRHVYGLVQPPEHEDFRFEWRDDGECLRDGHPLRCMFVASSSTPLESTALYPLLD
jgi:SAM-dependent methyltransferase